MKNKIYFIVKLANPRSKEIKKFDNNTVIENCCEKILTIFTKEEANVIFSRCKNKDKKDLLHNYMVERMKRNIERFENNNYYAVAAPIDNYEKDEALIKRANASPIGRIIVLTNPCCYWNKDEIYDIETEGYLKAIANNKRFLRRF